MVVVVGSGSRSCSVSGSGSASCSRRRRLRGSGRSMSSRGSRRSRRSSSSSSRRLIAKHPNANVPRHRCSLAAASSSRARRAACGRGRAFAAPAALFFSTAGDPLCLFPSLAPKGPVRDPSSVSLSLSLSLPGIGRLVRCPPGFNRSVLGASGSQKREVGGSMMAKAMPVTTTDNTDSMLAGDAEYIRRCNHMFIYGTHMYVYIYIFIFIFIFIFICVCVYLCVCVCACIYTHIHCKK